MKYVLDSSVALKWVLLEVDSGKTIRLQNGYSNGFDCSVCMDQYTGYGKTADVWPDSLYPALVIRGGLVVFMNSNSAGFFGGFPMPARRSL